MGYFKIMFALCFTAHLVQIISSQITLSNSKLKHIAELAATSNLNQILDNLLVDRSVINPNHRTVEKYIKQFLSNLGWTITEDEFIEETPLLGKVRFNNIIATLNPNATQQLVLACHYDSKYFPGQEFIAATDSAVPCAMMMDLAFTMRQKLNPTRSDLNLQLIFFDGEEAIKEWSDTDSLYGSRHLAARWKNEQILQRINLLILLDLIGDANPKFFSFFKNTDHFFDLLRNIEHRLNEAGLLKPSTKSSAYFQGKNFGALIQDDHIPFLRQDVPILHLIPTTFPKVWHTLDDNKNVIDFPTVENLMKILHVFVVERLSL